MRPHDPFSRRPSKVEPVLPVGRDYAEGPVAVLAVVDRYPPKVNAGAEWMLHAMLRDSVRQGHTVTVATGCTDTPYELDGVRVVPSNMAPAAPAEVVVGHLAWTRESIREARGRDVPHLYIVHNDQQVRFWRLNRNDVSGFVWNSEWIAAHGRMLPECRGVTSTVVRPPLVVGDYDVDSSREFVTLVNPIAAKGANLFYDLARINLPRQFLAVEGAYGSQMRPSPKHSNVTWQAQTGDIAGDVLARTGVLLVPSTYESWGRAACEALAAGIPVIASPTDGLLEACGDAAILVDPKDLAGWDAALASLDDADTYAEWSGRARRRAAELEVIAGTDLARWDTLVRLAAGATRVLSGAMGTRRFDPFAPKSLDSDAPRKVRDTPPEPVSEDNPWADTPVGALLGTIRNHSGDSHVVSVQVEANVGTGDGHDEWRGLVGIVSDDTDDPYNLTDEWIVDMLTDADADDVLAGVEDTEPVGFRAVVTFADGTEQTITSPTLPIAPAESPVADPPVPAATEDAGGDETATEPGDVAIPEKAADIVALLGSQTDDDQARQLAIAVREAEDARPGGHRASVDKAIAKILT